MANGSVGRNTGTITSNEPHSLAAYITGNGTTFTNDGIINIDNGAIGILVKDGATGINKGTITMGTTIPTYGGKTVGMAAYNGTIVNDGRIVVGAGIGMMVGHGGYLNNQGIIEVHNGIGIQGEGIVINKGNIILSTSSSISDSLGTSADAGIGSIKISNNGTITISDKYVSVGGTLITDGVLVLDGAYADVTTGTPLFSAKHVSGEIIILPNFAMTGNGKTYEIENFVKVAGTTVTGSEITPIIGPLFVAKITDDGRLIIVKRPYTDITIGERFDTLYSEWDKLLEDNPYSKDGMALKGMNTYLAGLIDESTYRKEASRMLSETRGDIYATIQTRMSNIQKVFDASFDEMVYSYNFTRDTDKYSIIYKKGEYKDPTIGIDDYDYSITGLMYMKEYESRNFNNKWGYTFGFTVSKFEFDDSPIYGSKSKEDVYSLRAGIHNVKTFGDDGTVKLLSRLELGYNRHEATRKLEMETLRTNKGKYNTYTVTLDNKLEKTLYNSLNTKIDLYAAINLEYGAINGFSEKSGNNGGLLLNIKDNDYFSIQPEIGTSVHRRFYLGNKLSLKIQGTIAYAYELGDNYDGNKVRSKSTGGSWTNLIEPEKEEGIFKGNIGVALEKTDHYGVTFEVERREHSNKKSGDTSFGIRFNYKFMNSK